MVKRNEAFKALADHQVEAKKWTLNNLFSADPDRGERLRIEWEGLVFDYAKQRINARTLELLFDYAAEKKVSEWAARMFAGEKINVSEDLPALHTQSRASAAKLSTIEQAENQRLIDWIRSIPTGERTGATGRPFKNIVNIGIGGSSVGPEMVIRALDSRYPTRLTPYFLTSLDVVARQRLFSQLNPAETLFVVVSKSFETSETLRNAHAARAWIVDHLGESAVIKHFAGVSANPEKTTEFGLDPACCFSFPDGIGGRFSLWSPAGLSIALTLGHTVFDELRAGAALADEHFRTAPLEQNIPVLMGLIGFWYRTFWGYSAHAVVSYTEALREFIPWLQQLEMESNGKQVNRDGQWLRSPAVPVIFGGVGTDVQHTFFQMLHQGLEIIPVDFISIARLRSNEHTSLDDVEDHQLLLANCLAQSHALMCGQHTATTEPSRAFSGNRPSTTFLLDELTPQRLGQLLALYEHKVFVQGCLWDINSFDQWGVELGKEIAQQLIDPLATNTPGKLDGVALDSSTLALMDDYQRWKK